MSSQTSVVPSVVPEYEMSHVLIRVDTLGSKPGNIIWVLVIASVRRPHQVWLNIIMYSMVIHRHMDPSIHVFNSFSGFVNSEFAVDISRVEPGIKCTLATTKIAWNSA